MLVLGDGERAMAVTSAALRRGGWSRSTSLAHVRAECLGAVGSGATPAEAADRTIPIGLPELAWALAAHRPPDERSVADLATRQRLEPTRLGRALALTPTEAAVHAQGILDVWQADLGPAVMAALGSGGCEGLAAILSPVSEPLRAPDGDTAVGPAVDRDAAVPAAEAGNDAAPLGEQPGVERPTLRRLLGLAPAVRAHAEECDVCGDRLRALVPLRSLLAQLGFEPAPAPVRQVANRARFRRPVLPVPLSRPVPPRRRWLVPVAVLAVGAAAATGGLALVRRQGRPSATAVRVADLTRPSALTLFPTRVVQSQPLTLANTGRARLLWTASTGASWLHVKPQNGVLEHGGTVRLTLATDPSAPEGVHDVSATVTGSDGSSVAAIARMDVEHAPTVAAAAEGCDIRAMVIDDAEVSSVVLHWQAPGQAEQTAALSVAGDGSYTGRLPGTAAVRWWITATDGRNNLARTGDELRPATAC